MTWAKTITATLFISLAGCQPEGQNEADTNTEAATQDDAAGTEFVGEAAEASYNVGLMVATDMEERFAGNLDETAFKTGVTDHFGGRGPDDIEPQAQQAMAYLARIQQEASLAKGSENLLAGNAFLAENGAREGVTTTDSGLQYEIMTAGDGTKPTISDTVTTHYHGTFIDGNVFDSSVQRGQPASFPVSGVISGWTEALQLMPVGSKWKLFVPSDLAYGPQDRGSIPPNSTLIFEVELLSIQ